MDTLVAELRRRLGGRFSAEELAELYEGGTSWCSAAGDGRRPADPWAWDSGIVVDAAFGRYLREAADYAGGRQVACRSRTVLVLRRRRGG